jgi:hypothetical protein
MHPNLGLERLFVFFSSCTLSFLFALGTIVNEILLDGPTASNIAFLNSHTLIATGSNGCITVMDGHTGTHIRLRQRNSIVSAIAVVSDSRFVTGDEKGVVVMWDLPSASAIWIVQLDGAIYNCVVSGAEYVFVGVTRSYAVVLDVSSGSIVQRMHKANDYVNGVAVLQPGMFLLHCETLMNSSSHLSSFPCLRAPST